MLYRWFCNTGHAFCQWLRIRRRTSWSQENSKSTICTTTLDCQSVICGVSSLTPFFFDLVLHELGTVDTLRLEAIVSTAEDPKETLLVTTIDREGSLVLDLESRSGATPRPVCRPVLALVAGQCRPLS